MSDSADPTYANAPAVGVGSHIEELARLKSMFPDADPEILVSLLKTLKSGKTGNAPWVLLATAAGTVVVAPFVDTVMGMSGLLVFASFCCASALKLWGVQQPKSPYSAALMDILKNAASARPKPGTRQKKEQLDPPPESG